MNEDILSFIWRYQYYETANLYTDHGQRLTVMRTGYKNINAGPDFSEASVVIDDVLWHGSVEIHVRSSDWFVHGHETDQAYEGVILHVVWENDRPIFRNDGTLLPVLSLRELVKEEMLGRFEQLQSMEELPCRRMFTTVNSIQKYAMLDRVLLERLDRKARNVTALFEQNRRDWDETAYMWLGKQFAFKLNEHAFSRLVECLPWKVVQKHRHHLLQTEALLFGMAGLLPASPGDFYTRQLRREFDFLAKKYQLTNRIMQAHEWKFAKLRPAGFPTIRLAQFASVLTQEGNLFSLLALSPSFETIENTLRKEQSAYWTGHYIFEKKSNKKIPAMGCDAAALLIINAVVPLQVAFSKHRQTPELLDKAIGWLSEIPAENNRITRQWATMDMEVKNAADSQALIEWHNNYCSPRKCLECTVGAALVRQP
jgi:hypothetical protein